MMFLENISGMADLRRCSGTVITRILPVYPAETEQMHLQRIGQ